MPVVAGELAQIADPPAVIPDPRPIDELPSELAARDPLAGLDRLEHRAVRLAASAHVVHRRRTGCAMEGHARGDQIGAVDVVAHLLGAIAEHGVLLTGHRALHQVGEETVQHRAGV